MAETDNFSEINENFDTIKTLLNSIRAQGILNTSDVDKLLTGINTKLEKINTEDDIELIKVFLSELKQNLDERHNVLVSKFGAIESLFSNLLKNSADALKSSEVKELFDIVATNLSVFSREVVSQKDTLTDITLRLDAMRSDDTQKKDIIKNINILRTDLEHLNNGFDSIVLSLNENFKTVVKSISGIDQSEAINKFGKEIENITNSSNTVLSALQLLDKKNTQIEDSINKLATQDDIIGTKREISELSIQNKQIADTLDNLSEKSYKLDNLSEKIDASVNIIAGLKAVISDGDDTLKNALYEKLDGLEAVVKSVSTVGEFEAFKQKLEEIFADIKNGSSEIDRIVSSAMNEVRRISEDVRALDVNANFQGLTSDIAKACEDIKEQVVREADKVSQISEVNVTRAINEISANAETLNMRIKDTQNALAALCKNSFNDVIENVIGLKAIISQIDENNVSANNAIFSNITDRLAIFENSLKNSLDKQEEYVSNSSVNLIDQMSGLKDITGQIDYKLDSSVIELNNSKKEFEDLKSSVQSVLDLDFVTVVKDLRVDLYAIKQDISASIESTTADLSDKITNDLYGKYELLISKLDNVEDEFKRVQYKGLEDIKTSLDSISSSIVDVISYVSTAKNNNFEGFESRLNDIAEIVKDSNLNYVENVRDIVEVIKTKVENTLGEIAENSYKKLDSISEHFNNNTQNIREDIKNSFNKLVEVQANFDEIKEVLNINNISLSNNVEEILSSTDNIKSDFESKLSVLKSVLLEKLSDFKNEFACENADKISELRFNAENLHAKSIQNATELNNSLKGEIENTINTLADSVNSIVSHLSDTTLKVESCSKETIDYIRNDFRDNLQTSYNTLKSTLEEHSADFDSKILDMISSFNTLNISVNNLSKETTSSLTSTLAKVLENFVSLKNVINSFGDKNTDELKNSVIEIKNYFDILKSTFENIDSDIDEDLSRQITILENNFDSLNNMISELISENRTIIANTINNELTKVTNNLNYQLNDKFDGYNAQFETFFENIQNYTNDKFANIESQYNYKYDELQGNLSNTESNVISSTVEEIKNLKLFIDNNLIENFNSLNATLKSLYGETSTSLTSILDSILENFVALKNIINSFSDKNTEDLKNSVCEIKNYFDILKSTFENIDSNIDEDLSRQITIIENSFNSLNNMITELMNKNKEIITENINNEFTKVSDNINQQLDEKFNYFESIYNEKSDKLHGDLSLTESNIVSSILEQITDLKSFANNLSEKNISDVNNNINEKFNSLKNLNEDLTQRLVQNLESTESNINIAYAEKLEQYKIDIEKLFDESKLYNDTKTDFLKNKIIEINTSVVNTINTQNDVTVGQLNDIATQLKNEIESNANISKNEYDSLKSNLQNIVSDLENSNSSLVDEMKQHLEDITKFVDSGLDIQAQEIQDIFDKISVKMDDINNIVNTMQSALKAEIEPVLNAIETLKIEAENIADKKSYELAVKINEAANNILIDNKSVQTKSEDNFNNLRSLIEQLFDNNKNDLSEKAYEIVEELSSLNAISTSRYNEISRIISEDVLPEISSLDQRFANLLEQNSLNFLTKIDNSNVEILEELKKSNLDIINSFNSLNERLDKDELSRMNVFQSQIKELNTTFNALTEDAKEVTKAELSSIADSLIINSKNILEEVKQSVSNKIDSMFYSNNDIVANESRNLEEYVNKIIDLINDTKQNTLICKDVISNLLKEQFETVTNNIEKETDIIASDLIEQFEYLKDSQKEEIHSITTNIYDSVSGCVLDAVNDLKSYFDVKSDAAILNTKFDNLKYDLDTTIDSVFENLNKLLDVSVFTNAITDLKATNEVLLDTMANNLNEQIQEFISNNVSKKFEEKINVFDKKFIDIIVDKYEEVKILSSQYNVSFENIANSVNDIISKFDNTKDEIISGISDVINGVNSSILDLHNSFNDLKELIINKNFDALFTDAVNNQITGLEALVQEQFKNIEDIKELCETNLPEISQMNSLVKYDIQQAISELTLRIQSISNTTNSNNNDAQENALQNSISEELNKLKSDIITQFLKVFNQITFVAEEEEIIDFVQKKHSELISILSRIVSTVDDVKSIKNNVISVDNKIDSIKEDINIINDKLSAIMSSEDDIDYVYSLQDLESDIANLRIVLNEMKENSKSSAELDDLVRSTSNIYELINTIQSEIPKFNEELRQEFKHEFDSVADDIVSISSRTNKLLLASDESYKTLQDNLQDFKLVINDLDERTRNFSREAGIDKLDTKISTLSQMIQSGAKTNQVFNQIFEYLAEWVDKAGAQIADISDRVETLNDIGQIKVMLEDLRAESNNNDDNIELVNTLSDIFDKQAKKINTLEMKLDRIMVDSIMTKETQLDTSSLEKTLNSFLTAIDTKMNNQQNKINSLESKLEEVLSMMDNKDTAQLTKKVGGMDKQIAKLNKSIEKIASHVVEK